MTFQEMFDAAKAGFSKADASNLSGHMAIQIAVTEDGTGIFYVEATDGVLNVQPYDYRDNTASVTLPHSTLLALLQRETTLPEAVAAGLATVTGCMESAAKLFAAVPALKKAATPVKEEPKTTPAETVKKEESKVASTKTAVKEEVKTTPVKETVKETATTAKAATTTTKSTTKTQPKRNCSRKRTK